jgi:hypothetical protein
VLVILKAFWQIALFREGPENLPDSRPLLIFALLAYALTGALVLISSEVAQAMLAEDPQQIQWGRVLFEESLLTCLDILALGVCTWAMLFYFGLQNRLRQTLTALAGVSAVLQALSWPAFMLLFYESVSELWGLLLLLLVVILLWSIAVYGHILSRAVSLSFGLGVALAVLYFIIDYQLVTLIQGF